MRGTSPAETGSYVFTMIRVLKHFLLALHSRITAKIVIAIVGGMMVLGILQSYLLTRLERRWLETELETQAGLVSAALHSAARLRSETGTATALDLNGLLAALGHAGNGLYIDLLDGEGRSLYSTDPGTDRGVRAGQPLLLPLHSPSCPRDEDPEFRRLSGVRVAQRLPHHEESGGRMLDYYRTAAMFLITVLILVVVWVVVQWPISRLMRAVADIERGDLSVHVSTPARDEFGHFADGVNSMLASLRVKNEELRVLHDTHLAQADRVAGVGQLASGLAHEIRNPLHGVNSALTVIRDRVDADTAVVITAIQNQISRVLRLLSDMLGYARPRAAHFELCDLNQVLLRTLALLNADIEAHRTQIEKRIAADLPATFVDPQKMEQVFLNLIMNAMQAAGDGARIRIVLEWERAAGVIVSRIHDNGPGVSPEVAERIFEPFFTTKKEGYGLGLPTSRMLVEQNGGTLRLLPTPGRGACFEIRLPVVSSPPPSVEATPTLEPGPLDAYLLGLACQCPHRDEERCPAEALRRIRGLGVVERQEAISGLRPDEKAALQQRHIECSFRHGSQPDACPPESQPPPPAG